MSWLWFRRDKAGGRSHQSDIGSTNVEYSTLLQSGIVYGILHDAKAVSAQSSACSHGLEKNRYDSRAAPTLVAYEN